MSVLSVEGVSHSPCSDIYCGPSGASEPETQAVADYMVLGDYVSMVSVHSYGRYWLFPYGYTENHAGGIPDNCVLTEDHDDLVRENLHLSCL